MIHRFYHHLDLIRFEYHNSSIILFSGLFYRFYPELSMFKGADPLCRTLAL